MIRKLALALAVFVSAPLLAENAPRIESLAWMSGAWSISSNGRVVEEMWTAPAGGTMIGAGRTVSGEKTKFFEFLRIEEKDGTLVYIAMPKGSNTTEFAMSSSGESKVTFSNPKHDFPKHITYWRDGAKLCARVEGDGEAAEQWCYERAK